MIDLSSYTQTLQKKSVAVFGLGLSGLSVVKALVVNGVQVTAWDDNQENKDKAQAMGAQIQDLTKIKLSDFDFLVLAPGVPYSYEPHPVVLNAQKYNLEIIGDLELLHRVCHGKKTIGITGTNGKSTTTALITHVLNECGFKAVMAGNIGKAVMDLDLNQIDILVLEISSYQMDLCPTYRPDISMLLNVTPDHLDRHGSMEAYVAAKAKILEGQGLGLISVDDDFCLKEFDRTFCNHNRELIPISIKSEIPEGLFVADNILYKNSKGENIKIHNLKDFETLKGTHNQQNMSFVYAACKELGLKDDDIFNAFKTYPGLAHRQFLITTKYNVTFINDSKATNAEAAAKALSSYDNIYWIVGGRPKKGGLQGLEIFKDKIIRSYLLGEATEEFSQWFDKYGFQYEIFKNLTDATTAAYKDSTQNKNQSVVLLSPACASWDQFTSFEKRGELFTSDVLRLTGQK